MGGTQTDREAEWVSPGEGQVDTGRLGSGDVARAGGSTKERWTQVHEQKAMKGRPTTWVVSSITVTWPMIQNPSSREVISLGLIFLHEKESLSGAVGSWDARHWTARSRCQPKA